MADNPFAEIFTPTQTTGKDSSGSSVNPFASIFSTIPPKTSASASISNATSNFENNWGIPLTVKSAVDSLPAPETINKAVSGFTSKLFSPTQSPDVLKAVNQLPDVPTPKPLASQSNVRRQNFGDVANFFPQFLGDIISPIISSGENVLNFLGVDTPHVQVPALFGKDQNYINAQSAVGEFKDAIASGTPIDTAYKAAASHGILNAVFAVPIITDFASGVAQKTIPEKLISPENIQISKQNVFDYLSGRKTAIDLKLPKVAQESIAETLKNGTRADKQKMLQGIDILQVKPSMLGKLLGITQEKAESILKDLYSGPIRSSAAGALPGYRARPGQAPAIGLSLQETEGVGFGEKPTPQSIAEEVKSQTSYKSKSQFTPVQIRPLKPEEQSSLQKVNNVLSGKSKTEVIAHTPGFVSDDGKERALIFDKSSIAEEIKGHGKMIPENLVINANDWKYVIKNVQGNPDKINLILPTRDEGFIRIGANKNNGFFMVTHYENIPGQSQKLKNLLANAKGDALDRSGRTLGPSSATAPEGVAGQPEGNISGVRPKASIEQKGTESQVSIAELRKQLETAQNHLDMAVANQSEGVFSDIAELKAKVDDLRAQIKEAKYPPAETPQEVLKTIEKRVGVKPVNIPKIQNQLSRVQLSLRATEQSPQAHLKAYGEDRKPQYEAKIEELQTKLNEAIQAPELPKAPAIRVSSKDIQIPEEIYHRQLAHEIKKEELHLNPASKLKKYVAQSGMFKGELPEVTGVIGKSVARIQNPDVIRWIKQGDDIASELGFDTSEEARKAWQEYEKEKQVIREEGKELNKDIKSFIIAEKDKLATEKLSKMQTGEEEKIQTKEQAISDKKAEAESVQNWKNFISTYAEEAKLPKSISEVEPPKVRGGIQAPKLDLEKWKDKSPARLTRETFERNIENVAPHADDVKIKEFLVDKVRNNELNRVKLNNKLRLQTKEEMQRLGLKRNTTNSALIQLYGEKQISLEELKKASPKKWEQIQEASSYYRNEYDMLIDRWNAVRKQFGYPEIGKRTDYFRHFDEVNFITKNYGLISNKDQLPTAIAGKSEFFKPGKPFSTAELSRTGNSTKYDAIGGFDNYLDTVSRQIFHIDSIQRGRALERYIENAAKAGDRLGTPLHLQGIVQNLREYVNNGLAGKKASLDRVLEHYTGRPVLQAFHTISRLIGKNIIVGNLSTALSHIVTLPLIGATTDKIPLGKGLISTLVSPLRAESFSTIDGQESSFLTRRYPVEQTMRTVPQSAEHALSYFFELTDKFKARLAVASKYYEGIRNGLSKTVAMEQADRYAGKVIGDYSLGQRPNVMNAQTMSIIAQFQLGLNDSMSVLFHDIPGDEKNFGTFTDEYGNTHEKISYNKWKIVNKFIQFAIFSFLFNQALKNIRGSGKGLDPIDLGLTLSGLNEEGQGQTLGHRLGAATKDLAGELPFVSAFTGNFPLATTLSQPVKDMQAGNYKKATEDVLAMFASPIGGGLQAKKTYEGIQAYKQGYVTSAKGVPQFPIKKGVGTAIQSAVFGPSGSSTAQSFYKTKGAKNPIQSTYEELKQLKQEGKTEEAQSILDNLSTQEQTDLKKYIATQKTQATKNREVELIPLVQQIKNLKAAGKIDEAQTLLDKVPEEDHKAFLGAIKLIKTANKKTENTFGGGSSTWDKQTFIAHVVNIAKASTLHPIEFFSNVFDGAGDWRVTGTRGNQIIVNRMPESASEANKRAASKDNSEWKLDHIWPLEAGGNNSVDNLQLIPTSQWSSNTAVENLIAAKLASNTINGAKAKEFAIRFKAGQGEVLSPAYMDIYKTKYKSIPITADEIANY